MNSFTHTETFNIYMILKGIHKYVPTDKIFTYCSMKREQVKELQKQKKAQLRLMGSKMVTAILFTDPSAWAGYGTRSIFKRSLTGFNSEFSFSQTSCLTKAEETSLSYYLPIAGGRIIGFIPFPRVLELYEMQLFLSRI